MKTVILCGGKGTRMGSVEMPKPLVKIDGKPILWHIMKIFKHFGFNDFILCLGHKGEMIQEYFKDSEFNIIFADTGEETPTGGRIKKIEKYIDEETFMVTYGDGVADIDLKSLVDFHINHGKIGTITIVRQHSQFGQVVLSDDTIQKFDEKPILDFWINGGFFVFNKSIFEYLSETDTLERLPFEKLASENQLKAFKHIGFWRCMDTFKDRNFLIEQWEKHAPWQVWEA